MVKDVWLNLPVKDVKRAQTFFADLGFTFNTQYADGVNSACLMMSEKNVAVMLFAEHIFKSFTSNNVITGTENSEVLISFSAESEQQVDVMAAKVEKAGGNIYSKPQSNQGWMYGFAFSDPDGHKWNMLYMDLSKMPK